MSIEPTGIPLQNVFYMLPYASKYWQYIKPNKNSSIEDFQSSLDILIYLLSSSYNILKSNGGLKAYNQETKDISKPKGRINYAKSLLNTNQGRISLVCTYNRLNQNSWLNQLLKYTVEKILSEEQYQSISPKYKKKLMEMHSELSSIKTRAFSNLELNKLKNNNTLPEYTKPAFYSCIILLELLGYSDKSSNRHTYKFAEQERLKYIFECFVLGLFKEHSKDLNIGYTAKHQFDNSRYQADCVIGTNDKHFTVIDCKWYEKSPDNTSNVAKLAIYIDKLRTDIKNRLLDNVESEYYLCKAGIVLYAESNRIKDLEDIEDAHDKYIYSRSLNMNQDFNSVKSDLLDLYKEVYNANYNL